MAQLNTASTTTTTHTHHTNGAIGTAAAADVQVIGAGFFRTGTHSLSQALTILYDRPCHTMYTIRDEHNERLSQWYSALTQRGGPTEEQLHALLRGYSATLDVPTSLVYKKMLKAFPNAKVILHLRDDKMKWAKSMRETVLNPLFDRVLNFPYNLIYYFSPRRFYPKIVRHYKQRMLTDLDHESSDEQLIECLDAWNNDVRATVHPDRLLIYRLGDGWEPLCKFLNKPVPAVDYPCKNDMKSYKETRYRATWEALHSVAIKAVISSVLAAAMGVGVFYAVKLNRK